MGLAVLALTLVLVSAFELPLHSTMHEFPLQVEDSLDQLMTIEAAASNDFPLESVRFRDSPLLMDYSLTAEIGIPKNGTAVQTFILSLSTNKEAIVVSDVSCNGTCPKRVYDKNASTTSEVIMERKMDSSLVIYVASDTVTVMNLTAEMLHIIVLKPLSDPKWISHEDGFLGLAPSYFGSGDSFVRVLALHNKIDKASFAVFLNSNKFNESVISFGEENNLKYTLDTTLTTVSCDSQTNDAWVVFADIRFDEVQFTTHSIRTEIRVEAMSIWVPFYIFSYIHQSICTREAECTTKNTFTQFKCNEKDIFPDFIISVSDGTMAVSDQFYIQRSGDICWLLIRPINDDFVILGQPFLYAYYLEFNVEHYEISFGRSINTEEREQPVSMWVWFGVGVGIGAMLEIGIIIYCRHKRRKDEEDEEKSLMKIRPRY